MQAEPGFDWGRPVEELVGFVFAFLATGAVGFRYSALRGGLKAGGSAGRVFEDSARRAAWIGLVAQGVNVGRLLLGLPGVAARQHTTVGGVLTAFPGSLRTWLAVLALVGFALAAARLSAGWPLAALGVLLGPLSGLFAGQFVRLVNPFHMLVGGLWIGSLFVLVVAGLGAVLNDEPAREERGRMAAEMVNGFSALALTCGLLLVASGVVTAWRHLGSLPALWSSAYGYALLVKLALVAAVFALGTWNWRRQRPRMGTENAAVAVRRSSRAELVAAALVLVATSIVVSLPAPAEQRRGPPTAPPAQPASAMAPAAGESIGGAPGSGGGPTAR